MAAPARVVLVGFMASGKTTVGRLLADRLGWIHIDLDAEIERVHAKTVAEIFETEGEPAFRALEAELTPDVLARERVVLTPGGGWIANPAAAAAVPAGTLTVWLRVSADEVVRRLHDGEGQRTRPLLGGGDLRTRVEELLAAREPLYARAEITIETTGRTPAEIAAELADIVRSNG